LKVKAPNPFTADAPTPVTSVTLHDCLRQQRQQRLKWLEHVVPAVSSVMLSGGVGSSSSAEVRGPDLKALNSCLLKSLKQAITSKFK
jgi:hypothetical protein